MQATLEHDVEYAQFKVRIRQLAGINLDLYKPEQMRRRLNTLVARAGAQNLGEFTRMLAPGSPWLRSFLDFFTINVSEFYRDPSKFDTLRNSVLPQLLAKSPALTIWSAGSSYGAEAYTLALLLEELAPGRPHSILGTDVDDRILARAKAAADYSEADLKNLSPALRQKYFEQHGEIYAVRARCAGTSSSGGRTCLAAQLPAVSISSCAETS